MQSVRIFSSPIAVALISVCATFLIRSRARTRSSLSSDSRHTCLPATRALDAFQLYLKSRKAKAAKKAANKAAAKKSKTIQSTNIVEAAKGEVE